MTERMVEFAVALLLMMAGASVHAVLTGCWV